MAKKLSRLWKIVLGVFAICFCFNLFRSSTVLVGLTNDGVSHSYTMTRKPSTWEIFWGMRALELWKYTEGHEDLAIALLKGQTLIGLKKAVVSEKLGLPAGSDTKSDFWSYFLRESKFEYGSQLNVFFDENGGVASTALYVGP